MAPPAGSGLLVESIRRVGGLGVTAYAQSLRAQLGAEARVLNLMSLGMLGQGEGSTFAALSVCQLRKNG